MGTKAHSEELQSFTVLNKIHCAELLGGEEVPASPMGCPSPAVPQERAWSCNGPRGGG